MEVLYTNPFLRDLQKVKDKGIAANIEQVILSVRVHPVLLTSGKSKNLRDLVKPIVSAWGTIG